MKGLKEETFYFNFNLSFQETRPIRKKCKFIRVIWWTKSCTKKGNKTFLSIFIIKRYN